MYVLVPYTVSLNVIKSYYNEKIYLNIYWSITGNVQYYYLFSARKINVSDMNVDPSRKKYVCDKCHQYFFIQEHYRNHRRNAHPNLRFWTCPICNKFSECKRWLRKHMESVHGNKKRFACCVCGATFSEHHVYIEHKKMHTGKKIFKCDVCLLAFGSPQCKKRHFRVAHVKETFFKCKFCNRVTDSQGKLEAHLRIHTGERSATCDECGKCFITKSHLKRHQKHVHSKTGKAQSIRCDICGMHLTTFHSALKHIGRHVDDVSTNSYSCSYCAKCYKTKVGMQRHELTKHGLQQYKCLQCGNGFNKRMDLSRHQTICGKEKQINDNNGFMQ